MSLDYWLISVHRIDHDECVENSARGSTVIRSQNNALIERNANLLQLRILAFTREPSPSFAELPRRAYGPTKDKEKGSRINGVILWQPSKIFPLSEGGYDVSKVCHRPGPDDARCVRLGLVSIVILRLSDLLARGELTLVLTAYLDLILKRSKTLASGS